jgi:CDP-diacylglycerol--serine O-phosphatidyltransferase
MTSDPNRPERRKRRRLLRGEQPISRLFPNMITIAGLCCGLSAIRFAMLGRWEMAVAFIIAAALIDGMDGRVARMLGATSVFGAQLDSLSDFLCFGVSPALVLYMWQLHDIKGVGWAVVLFFAVCTALRLARFNTALFDDNKEEWEKQFFVGVPSPAGGILSLLPLIVSLQFDQGFALPPAFAACYVVLVGALMASRIPTYAGKQLRIKHEYIPQFMIASTFLLVIFIIEPWLFLSGLSFIYLVSIYFSARKWRQLKAASISRAGSS